MVSFMRTALLLASTTSLLLALHGPVAAQNAHFVGKVTASLQGTDVQVCWKEAGLGNNQSIDYLASAEGTATYVCVNHGGQCPNAANKITVNGPVDATGTFTSGKNGSISACLVLEPPGPGSFACPGGQTLTLANARFEDMAIIDTTNGVSQSATTTSLSVTLFTCP